MSAPRTLPEYEVPEADRDLLGFGHIIDVESDSCGLNVAACAHCGRPFTVSRRRTTSPFCKRQVCLVERRRLAQRKAREARAALVAVEALVIEADQERRALRDAVANLPQGVWWCSNVKCLAANQLHHDECRVCGNVIRLADGELDTVVARLRGALE